MPCATLAYATARHVSARTDGLRHTEPLLQPVSVVDRVPLPVVVVVGEDVALVAPTCDPLGPLVELVVCVVAVAAARAGLEADEHPVGRALERLERPARVVADHERDAVPPQQ